MVGCLWHATPKPEYEVQKREIQHEKKDRKLKPDTNRHHNRGQQIVKCGRNQSWLLTMSPFFSKHTIWPLTTHGLYRIWVWLSFVALSAMRVACIFFDILAWEKLQASKSFRNCKIACVSSSNSGKLFGLRKTSLARAKDGSKMTFLCLVLLMLSTA